MFGAVRDRKQAFLDYKNIIFMKVAKLTFFQKEKKKSMVSFYVK